MKSFLVLALFVAGVSTSTIKITTLRKYEGEDTLVIQTSDENRYGSAVVRKGLNGKSNEFHDSLITRDSSSSQKAQLEQSRDSVYYGGQNDQLITSDSDMSKSGDFRYTSPEGIAISLKYLNENGVRTEDARLSRPVQMPLDQPEAQRPALTRITTSTYSSPTFLAQTSSSHNLPSKSYDTPAPFVVNKSSFETLANVNIGSLPPPVTTIGVPRAELLSH